MNKVVNITRTSGFDSRTQYDVYIGRLNKSQKLKGDYNYGNPFTIFMYGKDLAIALYKTYFDYKIKHDREFRQAIHKLKSKILGCYCFPQKCHGNIILNYLSSKIRI